LSEIWAAAVNRLSLSSQKRSRLVIPPVLGDCGSAPVRSNYFIKVGGIYDRKSTCWFQAPNSANLTIRPDKTLTNDLRAGNIPSPERVFNEALSENLAADCAEYENDRNRRVRFYGIVMVYLGGECSTVCQKQQHGPFHPST
jgi:hypothetical protein